MQPTEVAMDLTSEIPSLSVGIAAHALSDTSSPSASFDLTKQAAETMEKLAARVEQLEDENVRLNAALDMAVEKLAHYMHREECHQLAETFYKKGCIAAEDVDRKTEELYTKKVAELHGIRDAIGLMHNPLPVWGALDADDSVIAEATEKTSNEALEDILDLLQNKV